MTTSSLKLGDIVEVDKNGRRFHALIAGADRPQGSGGMREYYIRPLDSRLTWRVCSPLEIVGIWHANKATRGY